MLVPGWPKVTLGPDGSRYRVDSPPLASTKSISHSEQARASEEEQPISPSGELGGGGGGGGREALIREEKEEE